MKKIATFSVKALGMKPTEIRVLKALFSITSRRTWLYQLVDSVGDAERIDIWLVDRDNEVADTYFKDVVAPNNPDSVCINICSKDSQMQSDVLCNFRRPIRMQHLVKALDKVVVQKLEYVPPISDDMDFDKKLLKTTSTEASESNGLAGFSALVIDDSPTVRTMLTSILAGMAMKVVAAEDATQALSILDYKSFDIIFLDVILPGSMDGYKLCKVFKSKQHSKHTPVIMLTSRDTTLDRVRGKLAGAEAYLTKPVDQAELILAINKVLKKAILENLKKNVHLIS